MFGYVIPDRAGLSPEAQSRYRSAYCGLCRRIDALHGLRGRFSLSYDLTFLNILLCSLYEGETPAGSGISRCPIHPVHGVLWRSADPTDYCADLSVALHYYNAQDKWQDDHNLLALGYSTLLDNSTAEAAQRWPRQCNAIRACLAKLAEYEAAGSTDLDAVSGCFGALMAELFDYRQDRWAPELRSIGFHLGKFIYLLDAYDDLPRDKPAPAAKRPTDSWKCSLMRKRCWTSLSCCWHAVRRTLSVCPAWRTRTCCATSCIPACG